MFEIEFYTDRNGKSDVLEFFHTIRDNIDKSKTDRILAKKIFTYIRALSEFGTLIGQPKTKHIEGNIWELRPLNKRIFYFYFKDNKFILLSYYDKKTNKTPRKELEKARKRVKDFLERSYNEEDK